jgi:hypothetical protein
MRRRRRSVDDLGAGKKKKKEKKKKRMREDRREDGQPEPRKEGECVSGYGRVEEKADVSWPAYKRKAAACRRPNKGGWWLWVVDTVAPAVKGRLYLDSNSAGTRHQCCHADVLYLSRLFLSFVIMARNGGDDAGFVGTW